MGSSLDCGLDSGPRVWYYFVRGLASKNEFCDILGLTVETVLRSSGRNLPSRVHFDVSI